MAMYVFGMSARACAVDRFLTETSAIADIVSTARLDARMRKYAMLVRSHRKMSSTQKAAVIPISDTTTMKEDTLRTSDVMDICFERLQS